jgi:hypothetical protein
MTTWMQVMAVVRQLDERRRSGTVLEGRDADQLVTLLLDFHQKVVVKTPSGEMPAPPVADPKVGRT